MEDDISSNTSASSINLGPVVGENSHPRPNSTAPVAPVPAPVHLPVAEKVEEGIELASHIIELYNRSKALHLAVAREPKHPALESVWIELGLAIRVFEAKSFGR